MIEEFEDLKISELELELVFPDLVDVQYAD